MWGLFVFFVFYFLFVYKIIMSTPAAKLQSCYSYGVLQMATVHSIQLLSYMACHWREAGLVKASAFTLLLISISHAWLLRMNFNSSWSLRASFSFLKKMLLGWCNFFSTIASCFLHYKVDIKFDWLVWESRNCGFMFISNLFESFVIEFE